RPLDSYFCSSKKRIRSQMVWFFNMLPFLSLFFRQLYRIHVFIAILEKYDNNPVHQNITSWYDEELHIPAVLTKYLNRDIKFR
ncbi:hypothetical protein SC622_13735, partial [Legionella pneumophila serogroup 1]